jgi:hypothetical protein
MAGTTTKGLRYPTAGDNPAVHTDIQNLATDVDSELDNYILAASPIFTSNIEVPTAIIFEGSSADGSETTFQVTNPTADRTITLPDASGTVVTTGNLTAITTITSATITSGTLGNNLAAGGYKVTGLGDASELTDTDAVNVKSALNLARTTMLMLGGM